MAFCHSSISLPYCTARDQISQAFSFRTYILQAIKILEVGTAWEHSYRKFPNCLRPSVNKVTLTSSAWLKTECVDDNLRTNWSRGWGKMAFTHC